MLYITTASDILSLTKPHISKYYCFRLLIGTKAKCCCAATSSAPGNNSMKYNIKVKVRL